MKTLKFKTNINCGGCLNTVKPFLEAEKEIAQWAVNIDDPGKILTVATDLKEEEVINLVRKAGFKAESIK